MAEQLTPMLTEREREIVRLLTRGMTDSEIAETLVLTVGTVKWYNRQIYGKLDVRNRTQAITEVQRLHLLDKPAPTRPTAKHHLPAQVTSFVGRARELTELRSLLSSSRLVTLTGAPGTGKTRLALEVARAITDQFRDGVDFVSLAPLHESELVAHHLAQSLGVITHGQRSLVDSLKEALAAEQRLLVLDNFEHLLPAADLVSDLLAAAPYLTILITSREILHLYGEHEYPVPPLALPDLERPSSPAELLQCEAIELFVQRARAAIPSFEITAENGAAVAAICLQVDGLPLAIELAAARIKFYTPQNLLVRLGSRLEALNDGPRDLPGRQRTLRSTLAWSYDLLTEQEQVVFARLGVFAGGSAQEDIAALCADLGTDISAILVSLLNKSLLRVAQNEEPRYLMLETMREFALEKLTERGERDLVTRRHAALFVRLAAAAADDYYGPREARWLDRLEAGHDNLRAALRWTLDQDGGEDGLRFAGHLARFWEIHGHLSEGRAWTAEALACCTSPTPARAGALYEAGAMAFMQSDFPTAQRLYEDAVSLYRQLDDRGNEAHVLVGLGDAATESGHYETGRNLLEQAYAITQERGDTLGSGHPCLMLGWVELRSGHVEQGRKWLEQALAIYTQTGDQNGMALAYAGLGEAAIRQNRLDQAENLLHESLNLRRVLGDSWGTAGAFGSLAWLALRHNDFDRAADFLHQSLRLRTEVGDQGGTAWCLEKLAEMAHTSGDPGRAVRLYSAAASLRARIHSVIDAVDRADYEQLVARLKAELGADVYHAVWAEGAAMTLEQVIDYAMPPVQP